MLLNQHTIISDVLDADHTSEEIFLSMGMACMGCPASRGETVGEACEIHGVEPDVLLQKLRAHFNRGK